MSKRFLSVALIAVSAFAFSACDCCNKASSAAPVAVVSAAGESVIPKVELAGYKSQKFEANQFIASFSVELRDASKDGVYKKLADCRSKIFDAVKSLDIAESNIEQNSVSLTKDWTYRDGDRKLVGYVARQHFFVKMDSRKDAAMLTQMLSVEPDVEIYPTTSTLANEDSLRGVIIEAAVKDGMDKAEHYATGAGLKLGRVLYIGGEGEGMIPFGHRSHLRGKMLLASNGMDGAALDETAIADSVEISANVRLTIELR